MLDEHPLIKVVVNNLIFRRGGVGGCEREMYPDSRRENKRYFEKGHVGEAGLKNPDFDCFYLGKDIDDWLAFNTREFSKRRSQDTHVLIWFKLTLLFLPETKVC